MDLNLDIERIDFREHINYETAQFTERADNRCIINLQTYMHSNRKKGERNYWSLSSEEKTIDNLTYFIYYIKKTFKELIIHWRAFK